MLTRDKTKNGQPSPSVFVLLDRTLPVCNLTYASGLVLLLAYSTMTEPILQYHTHRQWDDIFDSLAELVKNPDTFDADILTDEDWDKRFSDMDRAFDALVKVPKSTESKTKRLDDYLFVAVGARTWIDHKHFEDYVELWKGAVKDGFLPDCVTMSGPSTSTTWTFNIPSALSSPTRKVGNQITPNVSPTPVYSLQPPLPLAGKVSPPGTPVNPYGHPAQMSSGFPSPSDVDSALQEFLANGGSVSPLPSSGAPGTQFFQPASLPPLVSALPSGALHVPAHQPIYDLAKFLHSYDASNSADFLSVSPNGEIQLKKRGKRIVCSDDWFAAMRNFGIALAASQTESTTFTWEAFILYIDRISRYFKLYSFTSVIEFDVAFRKWRRASNLRWDASNDYIRDLILVRLQPAQTGNPTRPPAPGGPKTTLKCNDFQAGRCNRPICRYSHQCVKCSTTWPASASSCVCNANGSLPQGAVIPPGVTFGQ